MASYYDRKDYSRPLHVDCSVEYELPNAAKPPAGARTEPLLMIHPCYYRRAESQRRSPFINNLPATRGAHYPPVVPHPQPQPQPPRYTKPPRDPLLCGSSGDSGVSGVGQWTDTSPLTQDPQPRLHAGHGPDSGIVDDKSMSVLTALTAPCWEAPTEPTSARLYGSSRCQTSTEQLSNRELRDTTNQTNQTQNQGSRHSWAITSDFLSMPCTEVNNNSGCGGGGMAAGVVAGGVSKAQGPPVGVAAVAACKACQPQFLHPQQQRTAQQPWPAVTPTSRHRTRAVEPGPEHAASSLHRRPPPAWPAPPAKRARPSCCKVCTQWNYPHCRVTDDNSRVLWNNDTMLRLYQV